MYGRGYDNSTGSRAVGLGFRVKMLISTAAVIGVSPFELPSRV